MATHRQNGQHRCSVCPAQYAAYAGSTGGIVVPTFKHGLTNTIPGLLAAWKRRGFIEGIHYVVGRKPPKSFRQPIIALKDY